MPLISRLTLPALARRPVRSRDLAVVQWIERPPPKRQIQVRFLSAGPIQPPRGRAPAERAGEAGIEICFAEGLSRLNAEFDVTEYFRWWVIDRRTGERRAHGSSASAGRTPSAGFQARCRTCGHGSSGKMNCSRTPFLPNDLELNTNASRGANGRFVARTAAGKRWDTNLTDPSVGLIAPKRQLPRPSPRAYEPTWGYRRQSPISEMTHCCPQQGPMREGRRGVHPKRYAPPSFCQTSQRRDRISHAQPRVRDKAAAPVGGIYDRSCDRRARHQALPSPQRRAQSQDGDFCERPDRDLDQPVRRLREGGTGHPVRLPDAAEGNLSPPARAWTSAPTSATIRSTSRRSSPRSTPSSRTPRHFAFSSSTWATARTSSRTTSDSATRKAVSRCEKIRPTSEGSSITGRNVGGSHDIEIRVECVDGLSLDLGSLCFAKIDVEGFEVSVLRGAINCIRAHQPLIVLEQHESEFVGDSTPAIAILQDLGYSFCWHQAGTRAKSRFLRRLANLRELLAGRKRRASRARPYPEEVARC